jgi:hypothetical protein
MSRYGFEFECSLVQYIKQGGAFVPDQRISSGSVPIHAGLFHGRSKDLDTAKDLAMAATTNLIMTAALELESPDSSFPFHPSSDSEVTASQIRTLADDMESGKITATAYSLTKPDKHQILQFVITTAEV